MSNNDDFQDKARLLVVIHANKRRDKSDGHVDLKFEETYVVWFVKTLKNWKALVSTEKADEMYYEVTYNGEKFETYVDSYKKWENSSYDDTFFSNKKSLMRADGTYPVRVKK